MSWNSYLEPDCLQAEASTSSDAVDTVIIPRARDLGGFDVRRALPAPRRQMVGPFIFFDQMGPAEFAQGGGGIDVRPHPHIGIATVTYLYKGEFQHRDSLGTNQMIYPGEVNWMVAGRGVTHSERTSAETRAQPHSLYGIQTWVALPEEHEDCEPAFEHHGKDALPYLEGEGKELKLILGSAFGQRAPVSVYSDIFYADAILQPGAAIAMPQEHEDRGVYVVSGEIQCTGDSDQSYPEGQLIVFRPGSNIALRAGAAGARLMLLGGEKLPGKRYVWWNFVASSMDKIHEAKEAWRRGDWQNGRFQLPPGDTDEFIPLPEE